MRFQGAVRDLSVALTLAFALFCVRLLDRSGGPGFQPPAASVSQPFASPEIVAPDVATTDARIGDDSNSAPSLPNPAPVADELPIKAGTEPATAEPRRLAIVDDFQPFIPKIVDSTPPSVELGGSPTPEPPKLVEDESPKVEIMKPAEPQTVKFFETEARAESVGFAVDCSSSMAGPKFEAVCNELASSILKLKPEQKFFVVFFSDSCFPMTGGSSVPSLVAAHRDNKEAILRFLASASAAGGTEPEPAIRLLASLKPDVIYLLTDGGFSPLSDGTYGLLAAGKVTVHSIGFETSVRVPTLEEIARRTGGSYRSADQASAAPAALYRASSQDVRAALAASDPAVRCQAVRVAAWRDLPWFKDVIPLLASDDIRKAVHESLCELADSSDFGPAGTDDVAGAIKRWTQWWTIKNSNNGLKKRIADGLSSTDGDELWVAAALARTTGFDDPDILIAAMKTAGSPIWQELHAALRRCCPQVEDFGPGSPAASPQEVAEAADRWSAWRSAEKEKERRLLFEKRCKRAKELLRLAGYFEERNPAIYERRCQEIVRDFGDTPSGEEAKRLLETLGAGTAGE
jgi:hypothetical protein